MCKPEIYWPFTVSFKFTSFSPPPPRVPQTCPLYQVAVSATPRFNSVINYVQAVFS
jgi:hypothetical protein